MVMQAVMQKKKELIISSFFAIECPGQESIRANEYKWLNFMLFYKYLYYSILKFKRVDIDLSCFRYFS